MDFHLLDIGESLLRESFQSIAGIIWVLIPLAGIAWFLAAGISEERTKRERQEQLHRERMLAMEKGMTDALERTIVPEPIEIRRSNPIGLLTGGIITLATGVGLSFFLYIAVDGEDRRQAMAVGLIPMFVGFGLILAWWVTRRYGGSGRRDLPQGRA